MPRRAKVTTTTNAATAADGAHVDVASGVYLRADETNRRVSLASRLEHLAQQGALAQAVKEDRPEVDACRCVLLKPLGRRSLDDIYTLKSLLAASRLLDFFSSLDAYKIDRLYQALAITTFTEKGAFVFHEGEPGDNFYMVFTGQVEIVRHDHAGTEMRLVLLKPGDTFGERALLSETDMRTASAVIASDRVELVFISRELFKELLREAQEAEVGANTLEKRFRSNKDIIRSIFVRHSGQRSEKDLKFAVEYLKSVKFFSRFSFEVRKQLCKAMRLISAVTNTVLFEEGQVGKHFYIIFSGSVEVSVRSNNRFGETSENVVSRLGEGDYFGELALSEVDGIRRATVVCVDYCELLILSRDQYEPLIKKYQNEYHAQYAQMLRTNAHFIGPEWDDNTIEGMCSVMTEKYFPFRSEVCKQGSRASEMFIVTRGECRMIHEGKHPITNQPQVYELGRFGPNSIIGCAEASAGKFNDIFVRDYSVLAESPVKILVLSRFDIFHLMSPEARESLQRSEAGFVRESIESRALKTVAWERYRKKFVQDLVASKSAASGIRSINASSQMVKSASTPVLSTERTLKQLVEPGSLLMKVHRVTHGSPNAKAGSAVQSAANLARSVEANESNRNLDTVKEELQQRHSSSLLRAAGGTNSASPPSDLTALPRTISKVPRRHTLTGAASMTPEKGAAAAPKSMPISPSDTSDMNKSPSRTATERNGEASYGTTSLSSSAFRAMLERRRSVAPAQTNFCKLSKSHTLVTLHPLEGSPLQPGTPLHDPSIVSGRAGHARTLKLERPADAALSPVPAKPSLWTPVHGVCQPFCLLGYMKEQVALKRSSASSKPRKAPPGSASLSMSSSNAADDLSSQPETSVVAFRVFGKFRDLDETLHVFRLVCGAEQVRPPGTRDTGRFAVYKEDEITMVLENFFAEPSDGGGSAADAEAPRQFRASDLLHGTGQRFACVGVVLRLPATAVEDAAVHVYQCFPTLQSAARFARQLAATAAPSLYVVPLFEWVALADLERFDCRSADLEPALEAALCEPLGRRSTWKARKDAAKKARAVPMLRSSS